MVAGLAFLATAIATVFAQATGVRFTRKRKPHERAWTIALALFALASASLATGASTGWDLGTFRAFYLLGAVLCVPWLGLGTVYLLVGERIGRRVETTSCVRRNCASTAPNAAFAPKFPSTTTGPSRAPSRVSIWSVINET